MSWRLRFHHLEHPKPRARLKQPRRYFHASQWAEMPKVYLVVAISKLATEERLSVGPARARFRAKRLRAVELFRKRFGESPAVTDNAVRQLPRLGK